MSSTVWTVASEICQTYASSFRHILLILRRVCSRKFAQAKSTWIKKSHMSRYVRVLQQIWRRYWHHCAIVCYTGRSITPDVKGRKLMEWFCFWLFWLIFDCFSFSSSNIDVPIGLFWLFTFRLIFLLFWLFWLINFVISSISFAPKYIELVIALKKIELSFAQPNYRSRCFWISSCWIWWSSNMYVYVYLWRHARELVPYIHHQLGNNMRIQSPCRTRWHSLFLRNILPGLAEQLPIKRYWSWDWDGSLRTLPSFTANSTPDHSTTFCILTYRQNNRENIFQCIVPKLKGSRSSSFRVRNHG